MKTEEKAETKTSEPEKKQEPEAKADDKDKSLLNEDAKDKKAAPSGAPEAYTDFTAPEGFEIDKDAIANALPLFKELNLPQSAAQKLVDFYAKTSQEAANAPIKFWQDQQTKWRDEIKADPEIGGKLDQVKATTSRMLDSLGDPKLVADFREAMDFTGAGNNPAFIRAFYKLASKLTEGTPVHGAKPSAEGQKAPGTGPKSVASAMYPNLPE